MFVRKMVRIYIASFLNHQSTTSRTIVLVLGFGAVYMNSLAMDIVSKKTCDTPLNIILENIKGLSE